MIQTPKSRNLLTLRAVHVALVLPQAGGSAAAQEPAGKLINLLKNSKHNSQRNQLIPPLHMQQAPKKSARKGYIDDEAGKRFK